MREKISSLYRYLEGAVPFKIVPAIIATIVLLSMLMIDPPDGLTPEGWHLTAIFLTTILAIILKVMPLAVMALMAIVIVAVSQVTSGTSKGAMADALSSFSSPLIWLIVVAVIISRGLQKTGLGNRIGLMFISVLGKRTLGIGYGLAICELILAPFTPSNTARGGGIVHPIMKSIAGVFDSDPAKGTQGKIGTYLALVNYHGNPISSGMFITATAPNPLVVDYVAQATNMNFQLSWGSWALYMFVPGITCMLLMPLIIYLLAPPEIKLTPDATTYAKNERKKMGPLSHSEFVMLGVFFLMLVLWANVPAYVFGPSYKLDPTVVAFIGLFLLLLSGTLDWSDVLNEKSAWDTLIWFGALVMMAEQLKKLGVTDWLAMSMKDAITASGMGWFACGVILLLLFVFSHYIFASTTAHISAMMLAFLVVGVQLIPEAYIIPFMLLMTAGSTIMMTLTHYATGTSPIVFGSGFVSMKTWWFVGFVMSIFSLFIYSTVGLLWWKINGLW